MGHPTGPAASDLRRQAAGGWPHAVRLQHTERVDAAPRAAPARRHVVLAMSKRIPFDNSFVLNVIYIIRCLRNRDPSTPLAISCARFDKVAATELTDYIFPLGSCVALST